MGKQSRRGARFSRLTLLLGLAVLFHGFTEVNLVRAAVSGPVLPAQPNWFVDEGTTLLVTNTASDSNLPTNSVSGTTPVTNTILFNYSSRTALLADGWSFIATLPGGVPRNTEITNPANGALVDYNQTAHPGLLRIPCDIGDLWGGNNSSRNSLFRSLPSNWTSMRLACNFAPLVNYQQVHLALYQDDDNFVQAGQAHNDTLGGEVTTLIWEYNAVPDHYFTTLSSVTSMSLRLDRNLNNGNITQMYSLDGNTWLTLGTTAQALVNPRLCIWVGNGTSVPYAPGNPVCDLRRLDVITAGSSGSGLLYQLVNAPPGASISTNGLITWTPAEAQGPGTNLITTVVRENFSPWLSATNSFTVVVSESNSPPVLPAQPDRTLNTVTTFTFTNTAADADLPVNALSYQLLTAPSNAVISPTGLITWTATPDQMPSTNVFTTVVTDDNPWASNARHLSATNSFTVVLQLPAYPSLPALPNLTLNGDQTLTVTNTASELGVVRQYATNTLAFSYPDRNALLADGWNFMATSPNGAARLTEITNPADPGLISYDQGAHPGVLRIPCDAGDLWGNANNSINSLFHALPANWASLRLEAFFAPAQNYQQLHLGLYQDDDNYLQAGIAFSGGQIMGLDFERNGAPNHLINTVNGVNHAFFRLDRAPDGNPVTGLYSLDGLTWQVLGTADLPLLNPRLIIWGGGSSPTLTPLPPMDLHQLEVLVWTNAPTVLSYSLLNAPPGASIDTNGVIRWTPTDMGSFGFTTVVTDNNMPPQSATNSFLAVVPTPVPPRLPAVPDQTVSEGQSLAVSNVATDSRSAAAWITNTVVFNYPSRDLLTNDGWSFTATSATGAPRPTEITSPANAAYLDYNQTAHPGALRLPCSTGDLWQGLNNTVNTLFRSLPPFWTSARLNLAFAPSQAYQQAHLTLYQNDDNYVSVGLAYNNQLAGSPVAVTVDAEANGAFRNLALPLAGTTNITFRLDRNLTNGAVTGLYSFDAITWQTVGSVTQAFSNPRLAIWTGGSSVAYTAGMPVMEVRRLEIVASNTTPVVLTYALADPPAGATIDATGAITWTPTEAQGPSTNVITTVVTDNGTPPLSDTNSFRVIVNEINTAPALPVQTNHLLVGLQSLLVSNTATDADLPANTLSYQLLDAPNGAMVDQTGRVTWTPAASQVPSTNVFAMVVTDSNPWAVNAQQLSATNRFEVVVEAIHNGPSLPEQTNVTLAELTPLVITNTAIDGDIPPVGLTYSLINPPVGALIDTNGVITWTPDEAQGPSTNLFVTVVEDGGVPALSATNSFTVLVNEFNSAPQLPLQTNHLLLGLQSLVVTNTATDPDLPTNSLVYHLLEAPDGATIDADGVITWLPSTSQVPSTNVFTTVVSDSNPWAVNAQQLSATNRFEVVVEAVHNGPSLPEQTNVSLPELTLLVITNTAIDGDIPQVGLAYHLLNAPAGALVDADGIITWTPNEAQGPSTNLFVTVVEDGGVPALSATNSFTVVVNEFNLPPLLPLQTNHVLVGLEPLVVTNTALDPDLPTNSLTYRLLDAPAGATIDAEGVLTWVPAPSQVPSTNLFTTVVTDDNPWAANAQQLSVTNSFEVVVEAIHNGPDLPKQTEITLAEHTALCLTNTALDVDLPPSTLSYSLINPPAGASIDTNGVITWTPDEAQGPSTNLFVTVVEDSGVPPLSATNSFRVLVKEINSAPQLPLQTNQVLLGLQSLVVTNTASDTDLPTNSLTYRLLDAPEGAAIDAQGVITWLPSPSQVPSTNVVATVVTDDNPWAVNDPQLSATNRFIVTVLPPPAPPVLKSIAVTEETAIIVWETFPGRIYRLQYKNDFAETNWLDVAPDLQATGETLTVTNKLGPASQRYFRVQLLP